MFLDRTVQPARGLAGGGPGAPGEVWLNDQERLSAKGAYTLQADDVVTFKLPGGAGYGLAMERDRQAIRKDVVEGYVSAERAFRDYEWCAEVESN